MKTKLVLLSLAACLALLAFPLAACKDGSPAPSAPAVLEAGITVANNVCQLIEGVTQNQTVETACVYGTEIAEIVAFILTLRMQDAGVPDGGTDAMLAKKPATCKPLPWSTLCATPREIGMGIEFVVVGRRARLLLDSGQ